MNLFEFIQTMKEMGTPFGIAGVAILGLFLIYIILKMLGGMRRGTWRQLVRTAATLVAAIVAFIFGDIVAGKIIGSCDVATLEGLIVKIESRFPEAGDIIRDALSNIDTEIIEYIVLLPAAIILVPFMTTIIFLLINLVFKIIRAIIIKICKFKKAKSNTQRLGGALLAAVQAIIWVTMVIFPLTGVITLVDAAYNEAIVSSEGETKDDLTDTYDQYFRPFTKNPAITFIESSGANMMSESIATVTIHGEKANIREEILSVAHVIIVDSNTLKGADFTALEADEKEAVSSIIDVLADSPFISGIFIKALNVVPTFYESGIIPLDFGGEYANVLNSFMSFLGSIERATLDEDLTTIKDFYFGFCDSGILTAISEGQDLMKFISDDYNGDRHILNMINTLSGNDRTKAIVDSLYNMVLNAAFSGSQSGGDGENGEGGEPLPEIKIEDVKEGLNNIVSIDKSIYDTEEQYREVLSDTIHTTINDTIGVELEKETVDEIADYVDENYSEQIDNLTDEEFNELIFEVIDIYQGYLNGEEINPDDLENLIPGDGEINPDDLEGIIPEGNN